MAAELWWWWLSPGAAWFVFFNVVVGAVAVVSWLGQGQGGGHAAAAAAPSSARRKLARTASSAVMERLRSIANFPFQYSAAEYYSVTPLQGTTASGSDYLCYSPEAGEEAETTRGRVVVVETAEAFEPDPSAAPVGEVGVATTTVAPPTTPVAAAAELEEEDEDDEESISLDEAYALARQAHASTTTTTPAADPTAAAVAWKREPAKVADAMRRPRAGGPEEVEGKAEVNARAERFIQKFREDLKLQRINSIINYTNALRRRSGSTAPAPAR